MVNALRKFAGKKSEKGLQLYIQRKAREAYILCHKVESKTERGWPDLVLIGGGLTVWVEVKSPRGGVLSQAQKNIHKDIRDHGGWVTVVAVRLINSMKQREMRMSKDD
jgi:hypothetical protein